MRRCGGSLFWTGYVRPLPSLALATLILNDHVLKGHPGVPPWLTGKLSDFVGLFVFPLFVAATLYLVRGLAGRRPEARLHPKELASISCMTALIFAALQLLPMAAAAYAGALTVVAGPLPGVAPSVTMDPTDLIALPCAWLAYRYGRRFAAPPLCSHREPSADESRIAAQGQRQMCA